MPLPAEIEREIQALVHSGFYRRGRIVEIISGEMHEPGELDPVEVAAAVDAAVAAREAEKATWPDVTDCDRLDAVFDALNGNGIIALHNAGYTQSDGYDDVREACGRVQDARRVHGYCFYHGQDVERAVAGGGLYLAFGPIDPDDEQSKGPEVGRAVAEELRRHGFEVEWNGTFDQRIRIPRIDWKRR